MSRSFDVAIAGGGPGGSATAISLRRHDPTLSVVLLEASSYDSPRIGETLPPPARQLLEHLGAWQTLQSQQHRSVFGTSAAWGRPIMLENDFLMASGGSGWHIDRTKFDAMLCLQAEQLGATVMQSCRLKEAEYNPPRRQHSESSGLPADLPGHWRLRTQNDQELTARFLVDATGSSAHFARRQGATTLALDRLVGLCRFVADRHGDPRTTIEATPDGWWYTAGLPQSRRIVAFMTDADIASSLQLTDDARWQQHLRQTIQIAAIVGEITEPGRLLTRSVESHSLDSAAGDHWLAVGDAASTFDPLSSQGIMKALRGGIFASYAIADQLTKQNDAGLERYRRFIRHEFESYATTWAKYYFLEQRWPHNEFWRRRHHVTLDHSQPMQNRDP